MILYVPFVRIVRRAAGAARDSLTEFYLRRYATVPPAGDAVHNERTQFAARSGQIPPGAEGKNSDECTTDGQGAHMPEDAGEHGGGPLDLSGLPLRELADIPRSVLDRELARRLARDDLGQEAAGFQSRV
jgi:hypothetical protein